MDTAEVWRHIDQGRADLVNLFESLSNEQWESQSLCARWRVRDVGAHLTQAHVHLSQIAWPLARSGFRISVMTRNLAVTSPLDYDGIIEALRAMIGSRRKAVGVTPLEPLLDVLVHTQDIAVPLGIEMEMNKQAAAAAADRTFEHWGPMRLTRRYDDIRFIATDLDWQRGSAGHEVTGPISAILMALSGRNDNRLAGAIDLL